MKEFNLEELAGIGPVTVKKLQKTGINSPIDIIVRGAKEFSRVSGLTEEAALKHTKACLDMIADDGLNIKVDDIDELEKLENTVMQIPVKVDELDEMTDGGFETQALYEVYGDEGSGKTQLASTVAMEAMGLGHGVMIIDCEGNFKTKRMKEIAEARGIEYNKELIGFHRYLDEALFEEGIQNIVPEIMEKNVKVFIIDGLVGLMRLAYQGRGELADRQMELKEILKYLRNMAALFNICFILTNQVTANPDPFGAKLKPIGGHVMGHYCKYIISFTKGMKNNRIVKLIKSPSHPQGEYKCFLNEEGVSQHETLTKKIKDKRMEEVAREDTQGLIKKELLLD
jgi:DNA repair protein RadA